MVMDIFVVQVITSLIPLGWGWVHAKFKQGSHCILNIWLANGFCKIGLVACITVKSRKKLNIKHLVSADSSLIHKAP